ncbi:MAG: PAS domain S-box protein, partial [Oricola sp.]|nr:PAS domain S-box protein [Oricola sp.]
MPSVNIVCFTRDNYKPLRSCFFGKAAFSVCVGDGTVLICAACFRNQGGAHVSIPENMTTTVRIDVLLEAIPEPAFVCNEASLAILSVNQHAIDRYGYSRAEFQTMRLSDLSPSEQAERLKKRLAAAGAGARVRESSLHRLASGESIAIHMSLCALDHEGEHLTLVLVREGVSGLEAEAQTRLLETSLERLNDMVIITEAEEIDKPGPKIVYVNNAFVRRTGYSREEALGDTPRILQGAKTQRQELDRIRKALEQKRAVRAELINYTKNGEEFWLEVEISPITDSDGNVTHYVAVERDVTGRMAATRALAESRARFSAVAEAAADIIWDWDLKENQVWWSRSYATVFGYPLL